MKTRATGLAFLAAMLRGKQYAALQPHQREQDEQQPVAFDNQAGDLGHLHLAGVGDG